MKIAIIGLGDIAQKAYLPILTQLENIELVFCTRDPETLTRLAKQYRIKETYQDYRALTKANIDAVMIHSSTTSHPLIATYFLQQGIATFVDKPLADNAFDCEKLYELAEKQRVPIYMGFNRRFIPLFQQCYGAKNLRSLRWEKNRYNLAGELRTFIFDDFIHPLDSVNLYAKTTVDEVNIVTQFEGELLARLDIQWQQNGALLQASMNRAHGVTNERVTFNYSNSSYQFDSFVSGINWNANQQTLLQLADWTPMLASKGFVAMIDDWLNVVAQGKLDRQIMNRNLASHLFAEALCQKIGKL
ncbi:gfo/Idh/MocA family oxidoreductase [Psychromonas sp. psych-6C06]|uniref:Gfo/Idh/MocA family protein n=1 Tax=Psychromonas sp. psych-6C06 TaxID=2058089 RepID=UPI000C32EE0F|nr:Gfo/Idh/MocA family oxidoreductase [Psychromonas sp. psych-6C06]PKF61417.1 gfo/Idh/MocA family oxidoreductase [Psychromonas sp. psych-6C06]